MGEVRALRREVVVGAVGAGGWGKNVVRTLAGLGGCALKYVCDAREEVRAANRTLYPNARVVGDLDEILTDPDVEALVVAVDAPRHFEVARRCLLAGKHTFVEKPLTLTTQEAEALVSLAESNDRRLMVGHLLLYHPAVLRIRELIEAGELGEILYLYCQRLNLGVVRQRENAWWSLAPHDISVAQFFLGAPVRRVTATGQCFLQPDLGVEDVVFATLNFDGGALAHIHASWLDPHKERKITVVGTRRMVVFDDMAATDKLRIYDKGADKVPSYVGFDESIRLRSGDLLVPAIPFAEPLRTELGHFLDGVRAGSPIRSDGLNGLEVVRVLVAGQRSLAQGGIPIEVDRGPSERRVVHG